MGRGALRNFPCSCGSGKKYKDCCMNKLNRSNIVYPNYFQEITDENEAMFKSEFSKEVRKKTGYWAEDYMNPVISLDGDYLEIYSDESCASNELYSVGLVVVKRDEEIFNKVSQDLDTLMKTYSLEKIHFADIFGRRNILNEKTAEFINGYMEIVSLLKASCYSVCAKKENVIPLFEYNGKPVNDVASEDLYHVLFTETLKKVLRDCKDNTIIDIWSEQENNFNSKILNRSKFRLFDSIGRSLREYKDKYISINMQLQIALKNGTLRSSLPDLVAYMSSTMQHKLNIGISTNKIRKRHYMLLKLINGSFCDYSGLASRELVELVKNI